MDPGDEHRMTLRCKSMAMRVIVTVLLMLAVAPAWAVEPGERLADAAQEARARRISQELRCLVCQNQSIDDLIAELARDLRLLVRERIVAGDTDAQVLAFVEARYGEFVLLRPPFKPHTLALWLTPLLLLIGTVVVLRRNARAAAAGRQEVVPLSDAEKKRLDDLLGKGS